MAHALMVLRWTVLIVFLVSCVGKLRSPRDFELALLGFGIFSGRRQRKLASKGVVVAEALTVVLLAIGGPLTLFGLALSGALLVAFSVVLARAVHNRTEVSCNCFGPSVRFVGPADLLRNGILLLCVVGGLVLEADSPAGDVTFVEGLLLALVAGAIVLVLTNLRDVYYVLRSPI